MKLTIERIAPTENGIYATVWQSNGDHTVADIQMADHETINDIIPTIQDEISDWISIEIVVQVVRAIPIR
jgi:hypothetical protein